MSLRIAFVSGVGIEKRWLKYLREAASSPFGPPYQNV